MQVQTQTTSEPSTAIERTGEAPVQPAETRARMVRIAPPVDIFENAEELRLLVDLPGVTRDAIELRVDHGNLVLTATDEARGRMYRRAFALPDTIDPGQVDAQLANGVLTVRLGKREDMKPRRIEIR